MARHREDDATQFGVSAEPRKQIRISLPMHTIVLATQKGGSGKSTLAIGLALAAKQAGHNVRLLETDPQGTLSSWQRRRGQAEPIVEQTYDALDIEPRLYALERDGATLVIIDTAGGLCAATTAAIRYADLCIYRRVPASLTSRPAPRRLASSGFGKNRLPSSSTRRRYVAGAS